MNKKEKKESVSKYDFNKYAVRLEVAGAAGSGFLFVPQNSTHVYVFTALHVVIELYQSPETNSLKMNCLDQEVTCYLRDIEICFLAPELTQPDMPLKEEKDDHTGLQELWEAYSDEQYGGKRTDAAVIRITRKLFSQEIKLQEPLIWLAEEKIEQGLDFFGLGYPDCKTSAVGLSGSCMKWDQTEGLLVCQAEDISYPSFYEAMSGFSGTGLAAEYHGRMVLIGIVLVCKRSEKHQCFRALGFSEIIEKMKDMGWDVPQECGDGILPDSFFDTQLQEIWEESIKYMPDSVRTGFMELLYQLSQKWYPKQMAETENFYDIPQCMGERKVCTHYWAGRAWILMITKLLNGDCSQCCYRLENGEQLGLEFVCTEGEKNADMAFVVRALINQEVLGKQIKGNSILLWQSRKSPRKGDLSRNGFKNIVVNISHGSFHGINEGWNRAGLDLLNGEMKEKDYGMIHVNVLVNSLDQCGTMEDVKHRIKEVLDGIWT